MSEPLYFPPYSLFALPINHAQVLDTAKQASIPRRPNVHLSNSVSPGIENRLSAFTKGPQTPSSSKAAPDESQTLWTPTYQSECRFKCCHFCRPSMAERAYLDMDAIVNGSYLSLTSAF